MHTHAATWQVLFFRVGDLQHMWRNLSEARKQAGEDADEQGELPAGPVVQVSDLQSMARLLIDTNKTDDVMFLPSSAALRAAQGQGIETAKARAVGAGAASGADAATDAGGSAEDASADGEEGEAADEADGDDPLTFEGEEEDAGGVL